MTVSEAIAIGGLCMSFNAIFVIPCVVVLVNMRREIDVLKAENNPFRKEIREDLRNIFGLLSDLRDRVGRIEGQTHI